MDTIKHQIERFFKQYAERFNNALKDETPDIEGTILSFASCFIAASPQGVMCGKNDDEFKTAIPAGYAYYKSIGTISMEIISTRTDILDEYHAMAKVHWKSKYIKKDNIKGSIEFDVIYFLQTLNNECKIFGYITGDEQKALRGAGLI